MSLPQDRNPPSQRPPSHNHLLAALPAGEHQALLAHLELVPMRLGEVLYEPGQQLRHAYFPTTAVASLHYVTASGASAETVGVGRDGIVGMALFMGGNTTSSSAMVHIAGHGYRIESQALLRAFRAGSELHRLLLRYTQGLITQVAQTAACYRHHSVEQQLSRWLLATMDRSPPGELVMTQDLVAGTLGVRRESVTVAAAALQEGGCIRYRRGHLTVVDTSALQTRACECYAVVKQELQRLLPAMQPDDHRRPMSLTD